MTPPAEDGLPLPATSLGSQGDPHAPSPLAASRGRDLGWLALAIAVIAAALLLRVTPDQQGVTAFGWQLPELCLVKSYGGTCPGCGMTRSFVLGMRGDLAAFRLHPAGPLLLLLLVLQVPYRAARLWQRRQGRAPWTVPHGLIVALLALAFLLAWGSRLGKWLS